MRRGTMVKQSLVIVVGLIVVLAIIGALREGTPLASDAGTTSQPATASPAPTATLRPVAVPETTDGLASILVQPGDLDELHSLNKKITADLPADYAGAVPRATVYGVLDKFGETDGWVQVFLYANEQQAQTQFGLLNSSLQRNAGPGVSVRRIDTVGDEAALLPGDKIVPINRLVWRRCRAVVDLNLGQLGDTVLLEQYAPRLDSRLRPTACDE